MSRAAEIALVGTSQDDLKQRVAEASLEHIAPDSLVGLGSGSTAELMVHALGKKVQAGFRITGAVSTSDRSLDIARGYGIPTLELTEVDHLDVTIDGADEVDPNLDLIKGGGGQHLHEKIVAAASARLVIIVDASKLVERLGAFTVPVEVVPVAERLIRAQIEELGGAPLLRTRDGAPYVTRENNRILDCDFGLIEEPAALARALADLPGVVEHGLFIGLTDTLIVGRADGVETVSRA